MDGFKFFKTFKERGEWVELLFMAEAMRHGYKLLKPWGDSQPFDVALFFGSRIVRVQVKSTSYRLDNGYRCQFQTNFHGRQYTLKLLDFFAGYVIPQKTWYLIPARILFNGFPEPTSTMLFPMQPHKPNTYRYACYREAWSLLQPKPEKRKPRAG